MYIYIIYIWKNKKIKYSLVNFLIIIYNLDVLIYNIVKFFSIYGIYIFMGEQRKKIIFV